MTRKPHTVDQQTLAALLEQQLTSRVTRKAVQKKLERLRKKQMASRYIKILEDIEIKQIDGSPVKDPSTGKTLTESHVKFIRERALDPAFVTPNPFTPEGEQRPVHWNQAMVQSASLIVTTVANLKPGDVLELPEDDWLRLKQATEKGQYSPAFAMNCIPFMRAINGATIDHPSKLEKKESPNDVTRDV